MDRLKGDLLWAFALVLWAIMLVVPEFRTSFIHFTKIHPYLGGFIKFSILASMGDLLGIRILTGAWKIPTGFAYKAAVWGILGIIVTLVFTVFTGGVQFAQSAGRLPFDGNKFFLAFFGSSVMNLTFGPMMYVYHRFGDMCVDHYMEHGDLRFDIDSMICNVDWSSMVKFSWLTTCLWVWIPCHTVVFLLPKEYQVLVSAFLSILLGLLVAVSKKPQPSVQKA